MRNTLFAIQRQQVLNKFIEQLDAQGTQRDVISKFDEGIELLQQFWNIPNENPNYNNLTEATRERMNCNTNGNQKFRSQRFDCYRSSKEASCKEGCCKEACCKEPCCKDSKKSFIKYLMGKQNTCCDTKSPDENTCICSITSQSIDSPVSRSFNASNRPHDNSVHVLNKNVTSKSTLNNLPLNKALGGINKAVSFDKRCYEKITELMGTQKQLQEHIKELENKETEEEEKIKKAQCMWPCMEEALQNKVQLAVEKQKSSRQHMKEIEDSVTKWRRNKKNIEFEIMAMNNYHKEIKDLLNKNSNNIMRMRKEIEGLQNRKESIRTQIEAVNESINNKKDASNARIQKLTAEITKIKKLAYEEQNNKRQKELEGSKCAKEAREDLHKIYRIMLQKKFENEHLRTEKESLKHEIDVVKKIFQECKRKCEHKDKNILKEIAKIDSDIANFKVRCTPCHKCVDTSDVTKFCTDCPRCLEERNCLNENGHCFPDATKECVCIATKQKFMDNVFNNMNTVLASYAETPAGKAVAKTILNYLKKSRNGKLNEETRKTLQNFIINTVKKNLNSTIIGGAIKTRCEMDADTYKQLMLCLQGVKVPPPAPKVDVGTVPKKEHCGRWGGTSECHCPNGPKACICTKSSRINVCSTNQDKQNKPGEVSSCPRKKSVCSGPSCCMRVDLDFSKSNETATLDHESSNNKKSVSVKCMKAVQCVIEQNFVVKHHKSNLPSVPEVLTLYNQVNTFSRTEYGSMSKKSTANRKGRHKKKLNDEGYTNSSYKEAVRYPILNYIKPEPKSPRWINCQA